MQLFAHSCHNLVDGAPFHQDHEFFGAAYPAYEADYDSVAERCIGLHGEEYLKLENLVAGAAIKLKGAPSTGVKENSTFYQYLLQMEQELCTIVQGMLAGASEGTRQLLGDICNLSEMRQYKIKQRLK